LVPRGGVEPTPLSSGFAVEAVVVPVGMADIAPAAEPRLVLDFSDFSEVPRTPVFRSRALAPAPVALVAVPLVELPSAALAPVVLPLAAPVPETPLVPAGPVEVVLPV
jgi:hypothetical protein